MRLFVFRFALAASLLITGMMAFSYIQDSIMTYFKEQTENLIPTSIKMTLNNSSYAPSYKISQKAREMDLTGFKAEDTLHEILREIAICR